MSSVYCSTFKAITVTGHRCYRIIYNIDIQYCCTRVCGSHVAVHAYRGRCWWLWRELERGRAIVRDA